MHLPLRSRPQRSTANHPSDTTSRVPPINGVSTTNAPRYQWAQYQYYHPSATYFATAPPPSPPAPTHRRRLPRHRHHCPDFTTPPPAISPLQLPSCYHRPATGHPATAASLSMLPPRSFCAVFSALMPPSRRLQLLVFLRFVARPLPRRRWHYCPALHRCSLCSLFGSIACKACVCTLICRLRVHRHVFSCM